MVLGDRVTVKNHLAFYDSLRAQDDVFIGPGVSFANDRYPRSKRQVSHHATLLERGCSLEAGSVILPGVTVGHFALVDAGAVVTRDVPSFTLVLGNPARPASGGLVCSVGDWRGTGAGGRHGVLGMLRLRPRLAVVVPVYGNELSLPELYQRIVAAADQADMDLTLQFVNDRSPDNSQAVLEELAQRNPRVRVALLSRNHGSFMAIAAGLAQVADHDAAVMLSADLQDPPETIVQMVDLWRQGKKVVLFALAKRDDLWLSRFLAGAFRWLFRRFALKEMPPVRFDFFLIDRAVIEYKRAERKLSYALHSIIAFSSLPIKLFGIIGSVLICLSLAGVAYVVIARALGMIDLTGWASIMISQMVTISVMLVGFGVVGGYLWINLEQTRNRPLFIIEKNIQTPSQAGTWPRDDGMPFFNLGAVSAAVAPELPRAAQRALDSPQVILGPRVTRFEREFAAWAGARHCVGVANGTDAITLGLWAAGLQPGARVAVPALTAPPTAVAVLRAGCTPVFVDVLADILTMDPALLEAGAAQSLDAVVPVHLYGNPCDMTRIIELCQRLDLPVVENCAQFSHFSHAGRPCGLFGAAGAYSFYPTKNLGAYGDAGAVLTDDGYLAKRLRVMRQYGQDASGQCVLQGCNSRLDEIHAMLLSERLRVLDKYNQERVRIAALYDQELTFLDPVPGAPGRGPHLYVVRPAERQGLRDHLAAAGIGSAVHYPLALTQHAYLAAQGLGGPCPVAEATAARVLSLLCHPGLHPRQVQRVIQACQDWRWG